MQLVGGDLLGPLIRSQNGNWLPQTSSLSGVKLMLYPTKHEVC